MCWRKESGEAFIKFELAILRKVEESEDQIKTGCCQVTRTFNSCTSQWYLLRRWEEWIWAEISLIKKNAATTQDKKAYDSFDNQGVAIGEALFVWLCQYPITNIVLCSVRSITIWLPSGMTFTFLSIYIPLWMIQDS